MQTASMESKTKEDSPLTSVMEINGLPESFFDYFEWTKGALCAGVQLTMFFTASSAAMSKLICSKCPVKRQCLVWALMYKEEGLWGGTNTQERKRLVPQYNIEALTSRAVHLGLYYPKKSAQEVRESLYQEAV